jgi:aspartyl-tRNA synthetase
MLIAKKMNNFFDVECETILSNEVFGLCDDKLEEKAYTDTNINNKNSKWIAIIENKNGHEVKFIAIDKCVNLLKEDGQKDTSCDCMMIYSNNDKERNIIFVELKKKTKDWLSKAKKQLLNTIKHFNNNHSSLEFNNKIACAVNVKYPYFHYSTFSEKYEFKHTGFTLQTKRKIKL